ncbi:MAG: hypothetical protein LBQ93_08915 [Treponema sp.]|jgi:hypothetical protein|nr:hypothetical protein [Treponema sp.]
MAIIKTAKNDKIRKFAPLFNNKDYDPYRRWLSTIRTVSPEMGNTLQDISYSFDAVGKRIHDQTELRLRRPLSDDAGAYRLETRLAGTY